MNQQKLPNATAVLVLGIFSLVTCLCYGIPGIVCGIVALVLYSKDKNLYMANPTMYSNYSNLNTGRILAIVGIILSLLWLFYLVFIISYVGIDALTDPELMKERIREM